MTETSSTNQQKQYIKSYVKKRKTDRANSVYIKKRRSARIAGATINDNDNDFVYIGVYSSKSDPLIKEKQNDVDKQDFEVNEDSAVADRRLFVKEDKPVTTDAQFEAVNDSGSVTSLNCSKPEELQKQAIKTKDESASDETAKEAIAECYSTDLFLASEPTEPISLDEIFEIDELQNWDFLTDPLIKEKPIDVDKQAFKDSAVADHRLFVKEDKPVTTDAQFEAVNDSGSVTSLNCSKPEEPQKQAIMTKDESASDETAKEAIVECYSTDLFLASEPTEAISLDEIFKIDELQNWDFFTDPLIKEKTIDVDKQAFEVNEDSAVADRRLFVKEDKPVTTDVQFEAVNDAGSVTSLNCSKPEEPQKQVEETKHNIKAIMTKDESASDETAEEAIVECHSTDVLLASELTALLSIDEISEIDELQNWDDLLDESITQMDDVLDIDDHSTNSDDTINDEADPACTKHEDITGFTSEQLNLVYNCLDQKSPINSSNGQIDEADNCAGISQNKSEVKKCVLANNVNATDFKEQPSLFPLNFEEGQDKICLTPEFFGLQNEFEEMMKNTNSAEYEKQLSWKIAEKMVAYKSAEDKKEFKK